MDVDEAETGDFEGVEDIENVGAYTTVRGIASSSDRINLGNSIITGLTFVSLLAWIEFIFYEFRHPGDQDLVDSEADPLEGNPGHRRVRTIRGRSRLQLGKFATAITIATVIAIFFLRRFPIRI